MAYPKEVVLRARNILAQRKADRESENAARLAHAYDIYEPHQLGAVHTNRFACGMGK